MGRGTMVMRNDFCVLHKGKDSSLEQEHCWVLVSFFTVNWKVSGNESSGEAPEPSLQATVLDIR